MTSARKLAAAALTALLTATGFLTWLSTGQGLDWRGWTAIIFTASGPVAVSILTPNDGLRHAWWPIRKVGALALTALTSSTVFLAWLGGTGQITGRETIAIIVIATAPSILAWLTPDPQPPAGTTSIDASVPIA